MNTDKLLKRQADRLTKEQLVNGILNKYEELYTKEELKHLTKIELVKLRHKLYKNNLVTN